MALCLAIAFCATLWISIRFRPFSVTYSMVINSDTGDVVAIVITIATVCAFVTGKGEMK
jgi:hypothetical protein